jgi:hypothetical protein
MSDFCKSVMERQPSSIIIIFRACVHGRGRKHGHVFGHSKNNTTYPTHPLPVYAKGLPCKKALNPQKKAPPSGAFFFDHTCLTKEAELSTKASPFRSKSSNVSPR